jgi:putative Mn2+ efflux pump MntP
MPLSILYSIVATGFTIAFFPAAIPTHWLPFVMASRAQKWSKPRTLGVVALAGAGHVFCTTLLGVLIVWLGLEFDHEIEYFPWIAGGVLIAFGLFYLVQQLRGHGHTHFHLFGKHSHDGCGPASAGIDARDKRLMRTSQKELLQAEKVTFKALGEPVKAKVSDRVAILSLVGMLTLSPCEAFLPVYFSGLKYGWQGFGVLSLTLAVATIAGMVVFTSLTMSGLERVKLTFLEKYESYLLGVLLCLLGVALILVELGEGH